jgi:hypothetical protein
MDTEAIEVKPPRARPNCQNVRVMPPLSNACTEVAYTSDTVLAIDIGTPCRDDKKTTLTSDPALTIDIGEPYKDDYSFAAFRPEPGSDAAHSVTASVEGRPSSGVFKDFAVRPEPGSDAAHAVTASVEGKSSSGVRPDYQNVLVTPPLSNACTEVAYTSDPVLANDIGTPCRDDKEITLTTDSGRKRNYKPKSKRNAKWMAMMAEKNRLHQEKCGYGLNASTKSNNQMPSGLDTPLLGNNGLDLSRTSSSVDFWHPTDGRHLMPIGAMPSGIARRVGSWTVLRR